MHTIENPRPIETTFTFRTFTYTQVKRVGDVAMYAVEGHGKVFGYEVIVIRVIPPGNMFGKETEAYERYPSDSEFGTRGWYYQFQVDAEKKFKELTSNHAP